MSTIKKFLSEKGKPMIDYEGYIYNLERKTEAKMIFRCHTNATMDAIVSGPIDHCHAPNIARAAVLELKNQIKSKAADGEEPTSTILHRVMCSFPLDSASQLPQHDTLLRTIHLQRAVCATNYCCDISSVANFRCGELSVRHIVRNELTRSELSSHHLHAFI